jgi:hypothetical protein
MYHKKFSVFLLVLALLIAGTGLEANAQPLVDLDIKSFRVTNRVSLTRVKEIKIVLGVKNTGSVDGDRVASITGVQDGVEVYRVDKLVSDAVGRGSTNYSFPTYTPDLEGVGDIDWTADIFDDDPDYDFAAAVTRVVP